MDPTKTNKNPATNSAQKTESAPKPVGRPKNTANPNRSNARPTHPQPRKAAAQPNKTVSQPQKTSVPPQKPAVQSQKTFTQQHTKKDLPELNIYPLGGLGEVGKNITVYECQGEMLLVDCGSLFPDSDMYGIDLVIPDFSFLEQNIDRFKGVVITHGHEDHIGALPYLLKEFKLPIYATRLTAGLIGNKLEEHGLRSSTEMHIIKQREKFSLGCFTIEPIHVNHSIPDAVALAIDSPAGVVIHTGDFKIDYTPMGGGIIDLATFAEYGKRGVLALLSDSTNSERAGMSASESKVREGLEALFAKATSARIIIATFASNLYRVQEIVDLAVQYERKVAISGRSMVNNTSMAMELGYLTIPDNVLIEMEHINKYKPEDVVLVTTGSQGETLSALSRMAMGTHRNLKVGEGDFIIISATPIPGNEKMVTRVVNGLLKLGAEVVYDQMYEVHASGHACQEEQKTLLTLTRPQYFIPLHGEYKHLRRHARTALAMGMPSENVLLADTGDKIRITPKGILLGEPVPAGAVMVDGLGVGDVGSVVLRDRRLLSQDGIVVVSATVSRTTGRIIADVDIQTRGFVYVKESEQLLEETRLAVQKILEKSSDDARHDINAVKTRIRETAQSLLYRRTRRSPMIIPVLMDA